MPEIDYQSAHILETPATIKRIFLGAQGDHFYGKDIEKAMGKWIQAEDDINGKTYVYSPDIALISEDEILEDWQLEMIRTTLGRMRQEVVRCLSEKGALVERLEQKPEACFAEEIKDIGWSRFIHNPARVCKISGGSASLPQAFDHPTLSDERLFPLADGSLLSIASDYSGHPTLYSVVKNNAAHLFEVIGYLLDAMKGCAFLHENDYAHGDVKPDNILVVNKNGQWHGMLFDFEGITKAGRKNHAWYTAVLSEWGFYGESETRKKVDIPLDFAWDIFSFGISLLIVCNPDFDYEEATRQCRGKGKMIDKQKALFQYIDRTWNSKLSPELKALIKSMLSGLRYNRPSLKEVAVSLEDMLSTDKIFNKVWATPLATDIYVEDFLEGRQNVTASPAI